MFALVLAVCASVGAESANEWLAAQRANQQDAAIRAFWAARNNQLGAAPNGRIQFAPMFHNPSMEWAVPNHLLSGPPSFPSWSPYLDPVPSIPAIPLIL